ncbi:MAG: GNAT family N-acetyltransferase [Blastocatellia bacterium]|nr:GNAT family N-acetyltransferase [Blastocatellia bacterium]
MPDLNDAILETDRLRLREITLADLDDIHAIWGDPEAMRLFPRTLDRDEVREWIARNLTRYAETGHGVWAVIRKEDGQFVGDCGLVIQDINGTPELEVGYHFLPRFWGHGYASEAARGCMDYARETLGRPRVISMIRPENLASRRVAERNGLRIEREVDWRGYQHLIYAKDPL